MLSLFERVALGLGVWGDGGGDEVRRDGMVLSK